MFFILRLAGRAFFAILFRLEMEGHEHIPKKGAVLLYANHQSNWDPPLLGAAVRRRIRFMAKEELFRNPYFARLFDWLGAFPVKRGITDRRAVKQALQILQEEKVLLVFPEGRRSKTGEMGKLFPGAAWFALKSDAVLIPVTICGNYKPFRKMKIIISPPLDLSGYKTERANAEHLARTVEFMMQPIQKNLSRCKQTASN